MDSADRTRRVVGVAHILIEDTDSLEEAERVALRVSNAQWPEHSRISDHHFWADVADHIRNVRQPPRASSEVQP